MTKVVGVRFRNVGKIYYFSPKDYVGFAHHAAGRDGQVRRLRLAAYHASAQSWRPTGQGQGAHHIGVAYGLRGVGLFGERVQRADEQPILVRQLLMFGAGDLSIVSTMTLAASYAA